MSVRCHERVTSTVSGGGFCMETASELISVSILLCLHMAKVLCFSDRNEQLINMYFLIEHVSNMNMTVHINDVQTIAMYLLLWFLSGAA